jgi:hypothetical protein
MEPMPGYDDSAGGIRPEQRDTKLVRDLLVDKAPAKQAQIAARLGHHQATAFLRANVGLEQLSTTFG